MCTQRRGYDVVALCAELECSVVQDTRREFVVRGGKEEAVLEVCLLLFRRIGGRGGRAQVVW